MESPIIYRKIQNDKKIRSKLRISGYKYISKVSACGEDTPLTLTNISNSRCTKYIRKLEFDPYLCEKSHMKPLSKVVKKFKDLTELNIVIRRLDWMNESDILEPFVIRQLKLKKLRFELTKIENINDNGVIMMASMFGRLYSVQEFDELLIGLDQISPFADSHFAKYGRRLKNCRKLKKIIQKSSFMKYDKRVIPLGFFKRMERYPNFTEVDYHVSMPNGWLSMSTESDDGPIALMTVVGSQIYLQKLTARFTGNPVTLETMEKLSEILPKLKYLRCLAFEFLNSRMSENEIIIFAQTLPQLKSLERLRFKAIQYVLFLMNYHRKFPVDIQMCRKEVFII